VGRRKMGRDHRKDSEKPLKYRHDRRRGLRIPRDRGEL
jgi:hypothetical protein